MSLTIGNGGSSANQLDCNSNDELLYNGKRVMPKYITVLDRAVISQNTPAATVSNLDYYGDVLFWIAVHRTHARPSSGPVDTARTILVPAYKPWMQLLMTGNFSGQLDFAEFQHNVTVATDYVLFTPNDATKGFTVTAEFFSSYNTYDVSVFAIVG